MKISNVEYYGIDDSNQYGLLTWYSMMIDGDHKMFGIQNDGGLLDGDGAPVTPGDELYRTVRYAIEQCAEKMLSGQSTGP